MYGFYVKARSDIESAGKPSAVAAIIIVWLTQYLDGSTWKALIEDMVISIEWHLFGKKILEDPKELTKELLTSLRDKLAAMDDEWAYKCSTRIDQLLKAITADSSSP